MQLNLIIQLNKNFCKRNFYVFPLVVILKKKHYIIGMGMDAKVLLDKFLRNFCDIFSARDMQRFFARLGEKVSLSTAESFLEEHPLVYSLEDGLYITKAGAFTGAVFSIKPTSREIEQGMVVPGDRCLPFADSEQLSYSLNFYMDGKRLSTKEGVFDSDLAIDLFLLYGEEYAPQYIASDPANQKIDFVNRDFDLPTNVRLTGLDISSYIKSGKFKKGDRLLGCVSNWDCGRVNLMIVPGGKNEFDQGTDGDKRLKWYSLLEKYLIESFELRGPCGSIEEQVASVFFEHRSELCVDYCGSVSEYLSHYAKKVGICPFGVETRLWYKGQEVPAVGSWNRNELAFISSGYNELPMGEEALFSMPDFVFDQYVYDSLYRRESNLDALMARLAPPEYNLSELQRKHLLLHLTARNDIISQTYNWFADQVTGKVRTLALDLYTSVARLIFRIDCGGDKLDQFPQQELIILSQLYNHLLRILQSVADGDHVEEDSEALELSLDGMRWNFEDIVDALEGAIAQQQLNRFKIVK